MNYLGRFRDTIHIESRKPAREKNKYPCTEGGNMDSYDSAGNYLLSFHPPAKPC